MSNLSKLTQLLKSLFFVALLFNFSCGGDDPDPDPTDPTQPIAIVISDFSVTIDENPENDAVLGTISASVNRGDLTYQLSDQTPAGALSINAATGDLTVADSSLFDFELNETLTATVTASVEDTSKIASITITLKDVEESTVGLITAAADFSKRTELAAVAFQEKLWVIGGVDGATRDSDIWSSEDGISWIRPVLNTFPPTQRADHTMVVFKDKLWLIAGTDNPSSRLKDVWSSPNGSAWTQETNNAPFGERSGHSTVVYNDKIWVIGGLTSPGGAVQNDVWSSTDGKTWVEETGSAAFSNRYDHSSVVYDGKMWIIGGRGLDFSSDKVWNSTDGITWTQVVTNDALKPLYNHSTVVFDDKMWVIAGFNGERVNDVWVSEDGAAWSVVDTPDFSARLGQTAAVYDDKVWLIGGFDGEVKNDVWTIAE